MTDWQGPLPNPTEEIRPFWDGLHRGTFMLLRCDICGNWRWPVAGCREHPNDAYLQNLRWTPASGTGTVLSFTVQHVPSDPAFPVPYIYAAIELEEGPVMASNIVNCAPDAARIGMPVRVVFRRISERYTLPLFEPVTGESRG